MSSRTLDGPLRPRTAVSSQGLTSSAGLLHARLQVLPGGRLAQIHTWDQTCVHHPAAAAAAAVLFLDSLCILQNSLATSSETARGSLCRDAEPVDDGPTADEICSGGARGLGRGARIGR